MKTYTNFIKESVEEDELDNIFLKYSHLDELEIGFNFFDNINKDDMYYMWINYNGPIYKQKELFEYNKKFKLFYIDFTIWDNISKKIDYYKDFNKNNPTLNYMEKLINKYLNIQNIKAYRY